MRRLGVLLFAWIISMQSFAQDVSFYKMNLEELASERMRGRAYDKGDSVAAAFIADVFKNAGAVPLDSSYFHKVVFQTNEVESASVYADGVKLKPGVDFIIEAISGSKEGNYEIYYSKDSIINFNETIALFKEKGPKMVFVRDINLATYILMSSLAYQDIDLGGFVILYTKQLFNKMLLDAGIKDAGMMSNVTNLMYGKTISGKKLNFPIISIDKDKFPSCAKDLGINVRMKGNPTYESSNVLAVIPGAVNPDSLFVFTAHYDHLGKMDDVYYAGANDNASGTAMLLSLADYYGRPENRPANTLVFAAVTGEEMGLLGSRELVVNPPFDLSKIKYVLNFDMVADKTDTLTTYSDSCAIRGFNMLRSINEDDNLFEDITYNKYEQNSDHYYFLQNNIPAICFIMQKGENFNNLHTIKDNADNVYYDNFPKLFNLVVKFIDSY